MAETIETAAELITAVGAADAAGQVSTGIVRAFLAARQARGLGAPVVEGEQVTFLYMGRRGGPPTTVVFSSERDGWPHDAPVLQRVGASPLYYHVEQLDRRARFLYRYEANRKRIADPLNPLQALKEQWAPKSELRMPAYRPAPERTPRPQVPAGVVVPHTLPSAALKHDRELAVYTPPGYAPQAPGADYPLLFFHDGRGYLDYAGTPTILDNMIAAGAIPPLVAVFAQPHTRWVEYGMNDAYVTFCADEVPAFLTTQYPGVTRDPARSAVIGASLGGLISVYVGWCRPDRYGLVGSYSGYTAFRDYLPEQQISAAPARPVRFYQVAGLYERHLNNPQAPEGSPSDLLDNQRRLARILAAKGYPYHAVEYPDGHNWGFWADHLPEALTWFFR